MDNTLLPTLTSALSDRSTDIGTLNLDNLPFKKRNPKFEKMRSTLKNSLFSTEKSHSLSSLPCSNTLGTNDDEKDTPTSENAEYNHDSARSLNNTHQDKHRKIGKGSLFQRPTIPSIGSIDKGLSEIGDESFRRQSSINSLGLTPTHSGIEEGQQESNWFGDNSKKIQKVEESKDEESSITVEESVSPLRKNRFRPMIPVPESLDNIDSSRDSDHRSGIFQRDVESEVEEIKKDLDVENDPHIHFIKGNFYSFYYEGDVLGQGTTGIVKKCTRKDTNEDVAVKVVHYRDDLEILILIVKEFKNHRKLNHKNIIKVYDLYIDYFKKKIYTVMELANCREMFDVLKDLGHYSEAVASGIFKQILTGINYLHHHGVCHRDLKPNNILVSEDGKIVKITDFNVSKFIDNNKKKFSYLSTENYKMWTYTGTIAFTAPEVFLENEYTEAVDMWSAGAVLYTMLCGYQPFQATFVHELIEQIKTGKYEFPADSWDNISKQAKSLVKHCLDINNRTRYSPSDALMHPWIANNGKIPNINIPRTVYYFNRYHRRNTGAKKTKHHIIQKSSKNSQLLHQPKKWKAGDFGFTQAYNLFTQMNNPATGARGTETGTGATHQEGPPVAEATPINKLQPKRGKTGPQIPENFLSGFLKLEKSFSCTVLEDPPYGQEEKCNEDDEQDEGDMSEGDQDIYRFFEDDDEILDHCPKQQADKERKNRKRKSVVKEMDHPLQVMNREEEQEPLLDKSEVEVIKGRDIVEDKENANLKASEEVTMVRCKD